MSSSAAHPRERARLHFVVVAAIGFAAIGVANRIGAVPPRAYGVLFVVVFAWLGLHHPPRAALKVWPLFVVAYSTPLIGANPAFDLRALLVVGAAGAFVSETISTVRQRTLRAEEQAVRSAKAFRIVAGAGASLQRLDHEAVLDAVVDAVIALGYDGANLVVIDEATGTFVLSHPRGLAVELGTERQPLGSGLTATVAKTRSPVVVDDYQHWEHAIPFYRHSGVRSLIGVPVATEERLVGVLVASTRSAREVPAAELEPLEALASLAGASLANVDRFLDEQTTALENARAAMTDALTGLPNRRHADAALAELAAGTAIVMIDVDHFRAVNERLGHAGGDAVLRSLALHLPTQLRSGDYVARFGGEELLLLLPHCDAPTAIATFERLAASWRRMGPEATFSGGIAVHRDGNVAATLVRADAALYKAKQEGRDRCCAEAPIHLTRS